MSEGDPELSQLGRRGKGGSKNNYLHFRVGTEMRRKLDAIVDDLAAKGIPTSRSAVARSILHDHLEMDQVGSEIEEALSTVWAIVHKAMGKIVHDTNQKLPGYLREGVDEFHAQRVNRPKG